ncbi:trichohyalin isoform X2 [Ischnura elegans]|uniref:trichohyalin isoform X2 n=1 Tax=Ischnura elegans TaxID=197161 RepID=UPI001ED8BEEE|nr:trichohyalin isoform X2 [Ischnura elegans]
MPASVMLASSPNSSSSLRSAAIPSCCSRGRRALQSVTSDLHCVHLELRRLHVTLTNQLHALKEATLRPRSQGECDPVAIARSLEESVGFELRQLRVAVVRLSEAVRDWRGAETLMAADGRETTMSMSRRKGIRVQCQVHNTPSSSTLPIKNSKPISPSHVQQHYTGNKWRNAQVREDIPRAKDEQRREMEEAALVHALHEQMLQRQEEIDAQVAQQLAEKIDREEYTRRRQAEERDKEIAWQLQERERIRLERLREERERVHIVEGANGPMVVVPDSPPEMASPPVMQPPLMQRMVFQQHSSPVQRAQHYAPKMAVTRTNQMLYTDEDVAAELGALDLGSPQHRWQVNHPVREEHGDFYQASLSPDEDSEFGVPEMSTEEAKRMQEEQDAELARLLQEQEGKRGGGNSVDPLDRDRLLAVEAQDRELARMLQEKERAKARRARERGKQRALLKKQQQMEQQQQQMLEGGAVNGHDEEDEPEYGTVVSNGTDNEMESPRKTTLSSHSSPHGTNSRAERPTELDLSGSSRSSRVSTGVKAKPRQKF